MKLPAGRQRALYIALGLVTLIWVVDLATRTEPARQARAAGAQLVPAQPPVPLDPLEDVEQVIRQLEAQSTEPPPLPDAQAPDPFVLVHPDTPEPTPDEAEAEAPQVDPAELFRQQHHLDGVLDGPKPVAIIDGVVCPVGSVIDGFRIVRIESTRVELRHGGQRVELRLEPRSP